MPIVYFSAWLHAAGPVPRGAVWNHVTQLSAVSEWGRETGKFSPFASTVSDSLRYIFTHLTAALLVFGCHIASLNRLEGPTPRPLARSVVWQCVILSRFLVSIASLFTYLFLCQRPAGPSFSLGECLCRELGCRGYSRATGLANSEHYCLH